MDELVDGWQTLTVSEAQLLTGKTKAGLMKTGIVHSFPQPLGGTIAEDEVISNGQ